MAICFLLAAFADVDSPELTMVVDDWDEEMKPYIHPKPACATCFVTWFFCEIKAVYR